MNPKQAMACSAIVDILRIFADTEIGGQYEINYEEVSAYLESFRFATDYFDCLTKEEVYERFTQDIYNGLPVWRWLILPEWTKEMVERSFKDECDAEYKELCKQYKCLTCKYYKIDRTEIGMYHECIFRKEQERTGRFSDRRSVLKRDGEPFKLKKKCKNYEVKTKQEVM